MSTVGHYRRGIGWRCAAPLVVALGCLVAHRAGYRVEAHLVFFGLVCLMLWGTLAPRSPLFGQVVTHLPGEAGVLITLDDGPDPQTTPALLDILDQHQAKALFFLIGAKAARHPELVAEILRRGHSVANHSMNHPSGSFWCLSPWRMWRELRECEAVFFPHLPHALRWFRPPIGHHNLFCHAAAQALGLRMMLWDCRGYDAVDRDVPRVLQRLGESLRPGSIMLLHDAVPTSSAVLEGALVLIAQRGLQTAPVPPAQAFSATIR